MIGQDYRTTRCSIKTREPQKKSILERAHQTMSNILHTFQSTNNQELEQDDPWIRILSAVIFAMQLTVHTTTQAALMQLVFGRDAIMNSTFNADWYLIKQHKQN